MKIIKVTELQGAALDWAVAKCEGLGYRYDEKYGPMCFYPSPRGVVAWGSAPLPYSTDWSQGGPIIEREQICLDISSDDGGWEWQAQPSWRDSSGIRFGKSPLIGAMKAYVASKLGDTVEVPDELCLSS